MQSYLQRIRRMPQLLRVRDIHLDQLCGLRSLHLSSHFRAETEAETKAEGDNFLESEQPKALTDEEVLAIRNKSRLRPHLFRQINGEIPYPEPVHYHHKTVKYKRKVYAKFGEASGINPGIQWPTHEQLKKRLEYESVAYPFTIQELMDNAREKRRLEQEYIDNRTKELEIKTSQIDKLIQEVNKKKEMKEKELLKNQERKAKMMEEVRRHFGYTMDPKDDRFQELLAKKEKEEKKRTKEAKKLEREKLMLAKLQRMSSGGAVAPGPGEPKPPINVEKTEGD